MELSVDYIVHPNEAVISPWLFERKETSQAKPSLMEISLMKIIEKWVCSKLMLCVIFKIARSQKEGVSVWKNAQLLVNILRKSMVAACLANVLQNVKTNSINNYKLLSGINTFHKSFCDLKIWWNSCVGNCSGHSNDWILPYATR